ncbi:MAG: 4a-hydroxytetrahydrobiopterin dehydratase [Deltaproteobacteria bacterium]|nr:4a-hydroxytetrahydrobiopterin dehydratase [Deltaproteobacteria bacterium]
MQKQKEESLAQQKCTPCRGGIPPLKGDNIRPLHQKLGLDWKVIEEHHLEKEFTFADFKSGLNFTNKIGRISDQEGHHPDIYLSWGKVKLLIWTHKIDGLTESDFILAAKADEVYKRNFKSSTERTE